MVIIVKNINLSCIFANSYFLSITPPHIHHQKTVTYIIPTAMRHAHQSCLILGGKLIIILQNLIQKPFHLSIPNTYLLIYFYQIFLSHIHKHLFPFEENPFDYNYTILFFQQLRQYSQAVHILIVYHLF